MTQRLFRSRADDQLPVTLSHQRVYILPTSLGWSFLFSLLLMLVASINYALSLGYALCFLLTGLFGACLLSTSRNLAGLRVVSINSPRGQVGAQREYRLLLENPSRHQAIGIDLNAAALAPASCEIPPTEQLHITLTGAASERGWNPLGRVTISSDFPLGLWRAWGYLHVPADCLVWPAAETEAPALPQQINADAGEHQDHNATQQQAFSGTTSGALRRYRDGDSSAHIAWRALARGQGLHSRASDADVADTEIALDWFSTATTGDDELTICLLYTSPSPRDS